MLDFKGLDSFLVEVKRNNAYDHVRKLVAQQPSLQPSTIPQSTSTVTLDSPDDLQVKRIKADNTRLTALQFVMKTDQPRIEASTNDFNTYISITVFDNDDVYS